MIKVELSPRFKKAYKKRINENKKLQVQVEERIDCFRINPKHPLLRDHELKGDFRKLRSFSITGDIRIVYQVLTVDYVRFLDIGTHNQVY